MNEDDCWPDGTPIWRGPPFPEPWGLDPRDRWVRVMAEISSGGVWSVCGAGGSAESLPISAGLVARIEAWQDWHDREDEIAWSEPLGKGVRGPYHYWEQHPGKPLAAFNAEGRAIARALKAELPPDWTVLAHDLDAWLPTNTDEPLILRP